MRHGTTDDLPVPPQHDLRGTVDVDGVPVAWESWQRPGAPTVLLVHGTSAHAGWWHHTVPWVADAYEVVALDLSGHGDSGRRASYSLQGWADEVTAVAREVCGTPALLVGHSIGGTVVGAAAVVEPGLAAGVVLVDSLVEEPPVEAVLPVISPETIFGTLEDGVSRYRLLPPQPVPDVRVLEYVARRALRPCARGGFAWKADPQIFEALRRARLTAHLPELGCPTSVIRGELSPLVGPQAGATLSRLTGRRVSQYDVPDAYHHVMIDQHAAFGRHLRRALDELVAA